MSAARLGRCTSFSWVTVHACEMSSFMSGALSPSEKRSNRCAQSAQLIMRVTACSCKTRCAVPRETTDASLLNAWWDQVGLTNHVTKVPLEFRSPLLGTPL